MSYGLPCIRLPYHDPGPLSTNSSGAGMKRNEPRSRNPAFLPRSRRPEFLPRSRRPVFLPRSRISRRRSGEKRGFLPQPYSISLNKSKKERKKRGFSSQELFRLLRLCGYLFLRWNPVFLPRSRRRRRRRRRGGRRGIFFQNLIRPLRLCGSLLFMIHGVLRGFHPFGCVSCVRRGPEGPGGGAAGDFL